jgi:hypothetical protein
MPLLRAVSSSLILLLASPATAAEYLCTPMEVAVFANRIHIRCSASHSDGGSTIWFWAVPTSDAQWANRVLSTATTGMVAGRKLYLTFTPGDTSGQDFGCLAKDCRTITVIGLR